MATPDGIALEGVAEAAEPPAKTARIDAGPAARPGMALMLGVLAAVGPISTDIYLPAFPQLEATFQAPPGSAGMTLSAWMIGLAGGQLTMGPVSDRFGRRIPMLLGMVLYTLASIGCAVAPSMWSLCVARFFAALGASACIVIPSACVRDISSGNRSAQLMSRLILIQGVVPMLAPMLGGAALRVTTWRSIFWVATVYGVVCITLLWRVFPETLSPGLRRPLRAINLLTRYVMIATDRGFITNGMIWGFCGFLSFTYLTAAPTVFVSQFGMTPFHFSMLFGLFSACMIGASQVNGFMLSRMEAGHLLGIAMALSILGAVALVVVLTIGLLEEPHHHLQQGLILPVVCCMVVTLASSSGVIGPNAMVGALANQPHYAGSASAFAGMLQYALGAIAGVVYGALPNTTPMPMAGLMLLGAVVMLILTLLRPGMPAQNGPADGPPPMMH